jgi:putative intracellular protease/amidase
VGGVARRVWHKNFTADGSLSWSPTKASSANADQLRGDPAAVGLVREFFDTGRPVAVVGPGPWVGRRHRGVGFIVGSQLFELAVYRPTSRAAALLERECACKR